MSWTEVKFHKKIQKQADYWLYLPLGRLRKKSLNVYFVLAQDHRNISDDPQVRDPPSLPHFASPAQQALVLCWGSLSVRVQADLLTCKKASCSLRSLMGEEWVQRGPALKERQVSCGCGEPSPWQSQQWGRESAHNCSPASLDGCNPAGAPLSSQLARNACTLQSPITQCPRCFQGICINSFSLNWALTFQMELLLWTKYFE